MRNKIEVLCHTHILYSKAHYYIVALKAQKNVYTDNVCFDFISESDNS